MPQPFDAEALGLTLEKITRRRFIEVFEELKDDRSIITRRWGFRGASSDQRMVKRLQSNAIILCSPNDMLAESEIRFESGESYYLLTKDNTEWGIGIILPENTSGRLDLVYAFEN